MRVLVACEYSGIVRDAFLRAGHDAVSCDLLPSESSLGEHYQGSVHDIIGDSWDMMIAHPPCTYLANSGVRWLYEDISRWPKMFEAAAFFNSLKVDHIPKIAIENPTQHKFARALVGPQHEKTYQPWQFGDNETKGVRFHLKGLPALHPLKITKPEGVEARVWKMPPGPNRQKERSRFFEGMANAMAEQWGTSQSKESE